jgi:alpha-L-arabinofuranosidase
MKTPVFLLLLALFLPASLRADGPVITIDAGAAAGKVSPLFSGLMTEEINHSYDGGLYAELVQNRAFLDDANAPAHWSVAPATSGSMTLDKNLPMTPELPVSLKFDATTASSSAPAGIANDGYWGIPVQANMTYHASFFAKAGTGFTGAVTVAIQSADGATTFAQGESKALTAGWKHYDITLTTVQVTATTAARFVLSIKQPGSVWFSLVSLFPPTWNDQANGFRKDLMQMMVDMRPKFLRFPGGNFLEGDTVEQRFDWKKTIGPISERPGHWGPWGYRSTDGMGLMEFLTWCEDMHAEPVLAVYAGYSLKHVFVNPGPDLQPYVQDALDEIEYLTGDTSTKWGAERARDGHPAPFTLHYVEIGNEDWIDRSGSYDARFAQFYDAIKAKYPNLKLMSTVGFEQPLAKRVASRKPDVVDEHYYRNYNVFINTSGTHYEGYDRKGPEIFVGEWAAYESQWVPWDKRTKALNLPVTPNMQAALGDACWMADMERNSDIVTLQCYAPLFANKNPGAYQWRPDLIGYDGMNSYGSPSYYAICMFNQYVGDEILKTTPVAAPVQASATRDSATHAIFVKLVNPDSNAQQVSINLQNAGKLAPTGTAITMAAAPGETNSLEQPKNVSPKSASFSGVSGQFSYNLPGDSIVVLKLGVN